METIPKCPLLHADDPITHRTDDNLDVVWGIYIDQQDKLKKTSVA